MYMHMHMHMYMCRFRRDRYRAYYRYGARTGPYTQHAYTRWAWGE